MTSFKLNISGINENIERYKKYSNSLKDHTGFVFNSLIGAESFWNDINTISFISRIKKDSYKIDEYYSYLKSLYIEMDIFNDEISSVCSKYGYVNAKSIIFNDGVIYDCNRYLNQAVELLQTNLNKLNSLKNSVEFASLTSVYNKITQTKEVINKLETLKGDINNFVDLINQCISNSKTRKSRLENNSLVIKPMTYGWKTTESSPDISRTNGNFNSNGNYFQSTISSMNNKDLISERISSISVNTFISDYNNNPKKVNLNGSVSSLNSVNGYIQNSTSNMNNKDLTSERISPISVNTFVSDYNNNPKKVNLNGSVSSLNSVNGHTQNSTSNMNNKDLTSERISPISVNTFVSNNNVNKISLNDN